MKLNTFIRIDIKYYIKAILSFTPFQIKGALTLSHD